MPASLGRRIRRIGIPPKEQRLDGWKVNMQDAFVAAEAAQIISIAKHRRNKMRMSLPLPKREHRRSKSRSKPKREVSGGKK